MAAISTATDANTPTSAALRRGCVAELDTHSSIVRTVASGNSASSSWTFWRTTGSSVAGGASVRTTTSISGQTREAIG